MPAFDKYSVLPKNESTWKKFSLLELNFFWQYQPIILEDKSIKKSDIKALYMCGTEMFSNDSKNLWHIGCTLFKAEPKIFTKIS